MTTASVYAVPELRLSRVRHDCANAATERAMRGKLITARQYARIAQHIDEVQESPDRMSPAEWDAVLSFYAEVGRGRM